MPKIKYKSVVQSFNYRYADNTYKSSKHVGTRIDAPFHMIEDGWKVEDIPLHRFSVSGQSQFENKTEFLK